MACSKVKISTFLKERSDRIKPEAANEMGLNRLEKIDFSGNIHINENKPTRTGMILVKNGDLVISGINVEKGALAVYEGDENLVATIHYSSYSYDKSKIDIEFLKWFLKSRSFKNILLAQTKGGIKTELKPKRFLPLEVELPDLPTQIEIRNKLNSVSKEVNEITQIQYDNEGLIQKLHQAILSEAIQGKLVSQDSNDEPASVLLEKIKVEKEKLIKEKKIKKQKTLSSISKDEIPFKIPNGWEWVRLVDILSFGPTNGFSPKAVDFVTSIKAVTLTATSSGKFNQNYFKYLDEDTILQEYLFLKEEDILIQRSNTKDYVGISVLVDDINDKIIYPDLMMKIRVLDKYIFSKYIVNALRAPFNRKYFVRNAKGTSATMQKINQQVVLKTLIPLPPLKEQKRIIKKVDKFMQFCDELDNQVKENQTNSEKLMDAILREAFANEA